MSDLSANAHQITPAYSVSPQLLPSDMATLAAQGYTTVIDNRPDAEVEPGLQAGAMQKAAEEAGLDFVFNPVVNGALSLENVEEQQDAIDGSDGAVMAYCRSGTRSAIVWALGQAGRMPTDDILGALDKAGYPMPQMRGQIDSLAARDS